MSTFARLVRHHFSIYGAYSWHPRYISDEGLEKILELGVLLIFSFGAIISRKKSAVAYRLSFIQSVQMIGERRLVQIRLQ
jgi:hypothetical protein